MIKIGAAFGTRHARNKGFTSFTNRVLVCDLEKIMQDYITSEGCARGFVRVKWPRAPQLPSFDPPASARRRPLVGQQSDSAKRRFLARPAARGEAKTERRDEGDGSTGRTRTHPDDVGRPQHAGEDGADAGSGLLATERGKER